MQIEITELDQCKLMVHYEIGAEAILNKRAEVINAFKKAPVSGFRPGKASVDAIKHQYKDQIEDALKRALAEDAYHNTLFEKKLRPHGAPRFNSMLMTNGKFVCDFELATKPDFTPAPFEGMEIPKPHQALSPTDVAQKIMQDLRVKFGESVPYDANDFVQMGDTVIVDYEGTIDGEKIENLSAQAEMVSIGGTQLFQFDENLLGMKIDESREFDLTVPETGLPSLAGKKVHFNVTLTVGSKNNPAPLNDELAVKIGKKDFAELQEAVNSAALGQVAANEKNSINDAINNRLVNDNDFQVPQWLALSEGQYLAHNSKLDWNVMTDPDKERFIEMGRKNVKLSLVLDRIRELRAEAQLSDQEIFEIVKQNLAKSPTKASLDDVIKEMNRTGYLQILFSRIRDEHTLDFVVKSAKIVD